MTSGGRSVRIVRLRTKATEFGFFSLIEVTSRNLPGGTEEEHEKHSQDSRVLADFWTKHIPNTSLERHWYTNLLGGIRGRRVILLSWMQNNHCIRALFWVYPRMHVQSWYFTSILSETEPVTRHHVALFRINYSISFHHVKRSAFLTPAHNHLLHCLERLQLCLKK
jgi:hypothetical protein